MITQVGEVALNGLIDAGVKGLLRSIGDAGAAPDDHAGVTLLKAQNLIKAAVRSLDGDTGLRVDKIANASDSIIIVHTVTAGKILYLTRAFLNVYTSAASMGHYASLFVRNVADVEQYQILMLSFQTTVVTQDAKNAEYSNPIPVPEGYDICVRTCNTLVHSFCGIGGWEE